MRKFIFAAIAFIALSSFSSAGMDHSPAKFYPRAICQDFYGYGVGAALWQTITTGSLVAQGYHIEGSTTSCLNDACTGITVCVNYSGVPNLSSSDKVLEYPVSYNKNMTRDQAEKLGNSIRVPGLIVGSKVTDTEMIFYYKN